MSEYTQGVCHDGAAILKDGEPMTPEEIIKALRAGEIDGVAFRAMCEAWQRLEEIVGLDTGGGMGPAPALNVVEQMQRQHQAMTTFVNEAINACFDGGGLDGAWIQERGEELGLLEAVEYDPAVHHIDCEMAEPGDTIYVRAAWLGTKSEEKQA